MHGELPRVQEAVLAVLRARGRTHAYEIKRVLRGEVPHASVYAALSALQAKGWAEAEWAIPGEGSEGGGPPRKYFEITGAGEEALAASIAALQRQSPKGAAARRKRQHA